jgi:hypothetical protein
MQSPAKYDHDNAGYYDCEGGADAAKRYAGVGSNLGAGQMRKLVKTAEMMRDPDFEEHLDQLMRTFCMLMFEVCTLVKGIKDSDSETAWLGLCLIAALRGLFNSGVRVSMDCPVRLRTDGRTRV